MNQGSIQVAILEQLVEKIRGGMLKSASRVVPKPQKVVLVVSIALTPLHVSDLLWVSCSLDKSYCRFETSNRNANVDNRVTPMARFVGMVFVLPYS